MTSATPALSRSDTGGGRLLCCSRKTGRQNFTEQSSRACSGKHFGDATVWITVASVLHAFNINPPLDERGETIVLTPKFEEGVLS